MRFDEDKIWDVYMGSLLEEGKKKRGLPPWLKKDDKKEDGDEKDDKKSSKKKGKNLPPWLKGKKTLKEAAIPVEGSEQTELSAFDRAAQKILETLDGIAAEDHEVNRLVTIINKHLSDNYDKIRAQFETESSGVSEVDKAPEVSEIENTEEAP